MEGATSLLERLEKEMEGEEEKEDDEEEERGEEGREEDEAPVEEGVELSELEEELRREEEIILLHKQDSLLEQVCDHQIKLNISWILPYYVYATVR